jgi:hypothetical protein
MFEVKAILPGAQPRPQQRHHEERQPALATLPGAQPSRHHHDDAELSAEPALAPKEA